MSKVIFTYRDLLSVPDDGKQYQILEGDLIVSPSPKTKHQRIVVNLTRILSDCVKRSNTGEVFCAPMDVILSDMNICQPDVLFISRERTPIITEKNIQGPPDLVVEVLSEKTQDVDLMVKMKIYARFDIPQYWIIDPETELVDVYELQEEGYRKKESFPSGKEFRSSLFTDLCFNTVELYS